MISQPQPAPAFLILDPQGHLLGKIERPESPEVLGGATVLLRRPMPPAPVTRIA